MIEYDTAWPRALHTYLQSHYGQCTAVLPLRGLSHNRIWDATFSTTRLVIKATPHASEECFYQIAAPWLAPAVPVLDWSHAEAALHWLVLEHIPHPLPRERWLADSAALAILHRLHHADLPPMSIPLFQPAWSDAMTEHALAYLSPADQLNLRPRLRSIQRQAQPLFHPHGWISGDPNPRNWGMRSNSAVVLFDWERLGRGTPALDLAITIPGLGDWAAFALVAERYLAIADDVPPHASAISQLTREIALAKVWNVIEFLSHATLGRLADASGLPSLLQRLPRWIEQVGIWTA
jgi:Phosphotransferase enzyme family